jgi:tetratricopeptide (TPR) repeat protein
VSAVREIKPEIQDDGIARAIALMNVGEVDEAYALVDERLRLDPNDAQWLCIGAEVLKKAKKLPIAYQMAKRATELKPDRPEPWSALGHAAQQLWRLDEAHSCYRKALQRARNKKQTVLYTNNVASTYLDGGQFAKAEKPCREALALDPEDVSLRHNLGLSLLAQHRWKEGWENYSASVGSDARTNYKYLNPPEPTWDKSTGTVVVYGEQGLGDEICAASMIPDAAKDARIIMDCDARLQGLFKRSFPQVTVHGTRWSKGLAWPKADREITHSISGFELGKLYRNADEDFPGTAYLTPCPDRTAMWKALFASKKKPVIGIAWSGGTWQNAASHRHLPLAEWQPLFDAVDAHWVSLQYKDASKDIEGTPVVQYPYATLTKDYDDTAALVAACDLVIGIQTSVNHLAGALGVPVWCLVPKTSQWRYGEEGDSLPWYRSMRIYRQTDKWPVKQLTQDLHAHFA